MPIICLCHPVVSVLVAHFRLCFGLVVDYISVFVFLFFFFGPLFLPSYSPVLSWPLT